MVLHWIGEGCQWNLLELTSVGLLSMVWVRVSLNRYRLTNVNCGLYLSQVAESLGRQCCLGSVYPQLEAIEFGATAINTMQVQVKGKNHPYYSLLVIGVLSLVFLVLFQAFGLNSVASADSRDEFPGRRQGGGTHWVSPTPAE